MGREHVAGRLRDVSSPTVLSVIDRLLRALVQGSGLAAEAIALELGA